MHNTAFISGAFDGCHEGHKYILQQAKLMAHKVIVAVNHDQYIRDRKNREPLFTLDERIQAIRDLDVVDEVVELKSNTPLDLIKHYQPDLLIVGDDYSHDQVVGNNLADVVRIERLPGISTTQMIKDKENAQRRMS